MKAYLQFAPSLFLIAGALNSWADEKAFSPYSPGTSDQSQSAPKTTQEPGWEYKVVDWNDIARLDGLKPPIKPGDSELLERVLNEHFGKKNWQLVTAEPNQFIFMRRGPTPAQTAEAAAVAFVKALKTKDHDAAMKLIGTPFLSPAGEAQTHDEAKAHLEKMFDGGSDDFQRFSLHIQQMVPFNRILEQTVDEHKARLEKLLGDDKGYFFIIGNDPVDVAVYVRLRNGKAEVIGFGG